MVVGDIRYLVSVRKRHSHLWCTIARMFLAGLGERQRILHALKQQKQLDSGQTLFRKLLPVLKQRKRSLKE